MNPIDFSALEANILYEDDDLLAINKPAGWVVNRSHTYDGLTVQDFSAHRLGLTIQATPLLTSTTEHPFGTPSEIFNERLGIVHRLDKDTSGVLLLAKNEATLIELLRQFKSREVHKTYVALVHGKLSPTTGIIRLPMERSSNDFKKYTVSVDGKLGETRYNVVEFYPQLPTGISAKKGKSYQGFSLVELEPKTGRTHQIRVHMSAIKHPLVGDELYTGKKKYPIDVQWCPRQFLHAKQLQFVHPTTKQTLTIQAPLPEDLATVLKKLQP